MALGLGEGAVEEAIKYTKERVQFGKKLIAFPRVADKLAMMAAEILIARQLTYFAAREKDQDRRCDIEAGMAKLLALIQVKVFASKPRHDPSRTMFGWRGWVNMNGEFANCQYTHIYLLLAFLFFA